LRWDLYFAQQEEEKALKEIQPYPYERPLVGD
jgi:hypothetical protein